MELLYIVGGIVAFFCIFFAIGIGASFIFNYWIMIIGIPLSLYVGFLGGYIFAIIGLVGGFGSIFLNNYWHGTSFYLKYIDKIDKGFFFKD